MAKFENPKSLELMSQEELREWKENPKNVFFGCGVTYSIGSDSYAWEVIETTGTEIIIRMLSSKNVGDYYGTQKWVFESDEGNPTRKLTFWKGRWVTYSINPTTGRKVRDTSRYGRYSVGLAHEYLDPSF